MKKIKKDKSQILFENNLMRSLNILGIKTKDKNQKTCKYLTKNDSFKTGLKGSKSFVSYVTTDLPEESKNFGEIRDQVELKKKDIESKEAVLKDKEKKIKELEEFVRKLEKKNIKRSRDVWVMDLGCQRMVAESVVKGIVEDLIWESMFRSLKKKSVSASSQKQACLAALDKIKKIKGKIEVMQREMGKQALLLIRQKKI